MKKDKLFLATINGELVGVMTMADAIKCAWNMDHATLSLEPEPEQKAANCLHLPYIRNTAVISHN